MSVTETVTFTEAENLFTYKSPKAQSYVLDENNNFVNQLDNKLASCEKTEQCKESFEEIPFYTKWLTSLGFYLLMIVGYMSQLLFKPKVTVERYRAVSYKILNQFILKIIKFYSLPRIINSYMMVLKSFT